jgi:hypothetical protein
MIKIIIAIAVRNSENEQTLLKLVAEGVLGVLSNIYRFSSSVDEVSAKKTQHKNVGPPPAGARRTKRHRGAEEISTENTAREAPLFKISAEQSHEILNSPSVKILNSTSAKRGQVKVHLDKTAEAEKSS